MTDLSGGLPTPNSLSNIAPERLYLVPRSLSSGETAKALVQAGHALPLLDGDIAFAAVEIAIRGEASVARHTASVTAFDPWRHILKQDHQQRLSSLLDAMARRDVFFGGVPIDRPAIMGIVNVTPDSFSDGGEHDTAEAAVAHAVSLADAGATILDVGGESTRPGASPVDPDTEQRRVVPVVRDLAERGLAVSIDTRNASTMAVALSAGAKIINDVTALTGDPESVQVASSRGASVILMHMQGEPQTMQHDPAYDWAPADVFDYLSERLDVCKKAGLDAGSICVDPGIGFGKNDVHNAEILGALTIFHGLGTPVMLGTSRKSFIGRLTGSDDPKARVAGSVASMLDGLRKGVSLVRVHDVAETRQALDVWRYQTS